MPRIQTAGGEKWMEIAFLRAILRAETFPPHDPWLSGYAISYYYFGYVLLAMIVRMAATPPSVAFNLGIASLFALSSTGAYGLTVNLLAASREAKQGLEVPTGDQHAHRRGWGGGKMPGPTGRVLLLAAMGPLLLGLVGNLEPVLEVCHARGIGSAAFWEWLDLGDLAAPPPAWDDGHWAPDRFMWWWQSSRVIRDKTPTGDHQEVIDEFPAFSFVLGDIHPHVLGLPFVLLALAFALEIWNRKLLSRSLLAGPGLSPLEFCVVAISLGALGFLNTWDYPIYLFVLVSGYVLAEGQRLRPSWRPLVARGSLLAVGLLVVGVLAHGPFWVGFQSQVGGLLPNVLNPTRLPQFLVMFAPLMLPCGVFVTAAVQRAGIRASRILAMLLAVVLCLLAAVALVILIGAGLLFSDLLSPVGPLAEAAAWLREPGSNVLDWAGGQWPPLASSLLAHFVNPWTSVLLAFLLVSSALCLLRLLRSGANESPQDRLRIRGDGFVLLLVLTGALLTLAVEYVYVRDIFGTRMNTVFKFYFQAWVVWSLAGATFLGRCLLGQERSALATVGLLASVGLCLMGLLFPILAIPARAREYGGPPTLDGAEHLARQHPDDYAAIAWLNENVTGSPVLLEAPGGGYEYAGRVSAHTGLPSLLGWAGHEHQWRGSRDVPTMREQDIETLYATEDIHRADTLLDQYEVSYVYVGPLELTRYPPAGLAKFRGLLEPVYEAGNVVIYEHVFQ
jgi:uncharacterized membrane protein